MSATTLNLGKGQIDALLTRAPQLLNTLQTNSTKLVNNAKPVLGRLPAGVAASVTDLLNKFIETTKKLFKELARPITEPGDPWALWQAGTDWTTKVGNVMSGQVAVLGTPAALDDDWNGPAATRYGGVLTEQKTAISAIKKVTDPLQNTLTNAANAIIALWVGLVAAFVSALPDVVGAAVAVAGVVTIPAAIALAVKAVLQLLAFAVAVLAATAVYLQSAKTQLASLQQLQGVEGFVPDGKDPAKRHWPSLTQRIDNGKDW